MFLQVAKNEEACLSVFELIRVVSHLWVFNYIEVL